jgi:hypothetical protein
MYIEIPGFEARGVWEITQKVGNLSGAVNIHSMAYDSATGKALWLGQEVVGKKLMRHSLGFGLSQKMSEDDVLCRIRYTNLEDIFAIEAVFAEMTRLIPLIESGEVAPESGYVEIHRQGAVFAFKMNLSTNSVLAYTRGEDDKLEPVGLKTGSPFTNYLQILVITPNGEIDIGGYDLYCGIDSALRVAHDFEVMRALIDGKPEAEILAMKPIREPEPRLKIDLGAIAEKALEDMLSSIETSEEAEPEKTVIH